MLRVFVMSLVSRMAAAGLAAKERAGAKAEARRETADSTSSERVAARSCCARSARTIMVGPSHSQRVNTVVERADRRQTGRYGVCLQSPVSGQRHGWLAGEPPASLFSSYLSLSCLRPSMRDMRDDRHLHAMGCRSWLLGLSDLLN
jgi:hypothetical protein